MTTLDLDNLGLRSDFFLDPDLAFLNHGSFGACPRSVIEHYQHWQLEQERDPVYFQSTRQHELLDSVRRRLARSVGVDSDDLAFVTNATMGMNIVAQSLDLQPGDQVLSTDLEYGAIDHTWMEVCRRTGAAYVRQPVPLPCDDPQQMVEAIWAGVTDSTKVLSLSHITSGTALIVPIAELVQRARAADIVTVIDGAHAPGQLNLDLNALGADYYTGNCHKWMMAPKSCGFLHARREAQERLRPLIVGWGWRECADERTGFVCEQMSQGTRDASPFLAVTAAMDYMASHDWPNVQAACHALLQVTRQRIVAITGLQPLVPDSGDWYKQMATLPLPACDNHALRAKLYQDYRIRVPVTMWRDTPLLRVSIQGYNTMRDVDRLVEAIQTEFA